MGISFLGTGTMAVRFWRRNFAWLPRWDTKTKPYCSSTFTMCLEEYSLGMLQAQGSQLGVLDVLDAWVWAIVKV